MSNKLANRKKASQREQFEGKLQQFSSQMQYMQTRLKGVEYAVNDTVEYFLGWHKWIPFRIPSKWGLRRYLTKRQKERMAVAKARREEMMAAQRRALEKKVEDDFNKLPLKEQKRIQAENKKAQLEAVKKGGEINARVS